MSQARVRAVWTMLALAGGAAHAADPQRYKVEFTDTPVKALNDMLKGTSELSSLRKSAPVSPFGLIGRAHSDIDRLKTVLESFGYYQGSVQVTIDSLALEDPALGDELVNRAAKDDARVRLAFTLGEQYHLGSVSLSGELPPEAADALQLKPGAPAMAADVLAGAERVRRALADEGYAFAKVSPPLAKENSAQHVLNVSLEVTPGARYRIGEIRLAGLERTREQYVRKRLLIHPGDQYKASAIEAARQDLLAVGVFTQVTVKLEPSPDADGRVALTFNFRERKSHAVGLTAAYSSDLGTSAGVKWTQREMSGRADSLTLSANVIDLGGGTATNGIGYDLNGTYLIPDWKQRDQSLQVQLGALRQSLNAYDQTAATAGLTVIRKLSRRWTVSAGLTLEREQITQEAPPDDAQSAAVGCTQNIAPPLAGTTEPRCTYHYTLVGLPLTGSYNSTGLDSPLADATHGVRTSLTLTPTFSVGNQTSEFLVTQLTAAAFFDLNRWGLSSVPGRRVLAVRGLAGLAVGASEFSLPPDQRFYAGGSGTIRGYRYQSVGPAFQDGNPIGGTAINAGSLEFRQRIGESLGFATFVDAGNVSRTLNPISGSLKVGVGAGVRYYTALGPLRVDLAVPLQRRSGAGVIAPDDAFEVYIGLGQAF